MSVSFLVCSVRVIGESDIMQEFLSESDEVKTTHLCFLCNCILRFVIFSVLQLPAVIVAGHSFSII